jgi:hypothetical protein
MDIRELSTGSPNLTVSLSILMRFYGQAKSDHWIEPELIMIVPLAVRIRSF